MYSATEYCKVEPLIEIYRHLLYPFYAVSKYCKLQIRYQWNMRCLQNGKLCILKILRTKIFCTLPNLFIETNTPHNGIIVFL